MQTSTTSVRSTTATYLRHGQNASFELPFALLQYLSHTGMAILHRLLGPRKPGTQVQEACHLPECLPGDEKRDEY